MPPTPTWFTGQRAFIGFLGNRLFYKDFWRFVLTRANGQPTFIIYERASDDNYAHMALRS